MKPARDPKTFRQHFELDYHHRKGVLRRWKWWLSVAAFVLCSAVTTAAIVVPRWHWVFQAGPVTHVHARFGLDCQACHVEAFSTVWRLWPGNAAMSTVTDAACLKCHDAGRHDPHQLRHTGPDCKQAAGCVECHREHHAVELKRLPDQACTQCHADLQTKDRADNYAKTIRHFDDGHPEFGAWRRARFSDPAGDALRFNHQRHLELAANYAPTQNAAIATQFEKLKADGCAYCHQTDPAGRSMKPISYRDHCAACHPLTVQATPAGTWPLAIQQQFAGEPVPHPAPDETAAKVRAALLERYLKLAGSEVAATGQPVVQPPLLRDPVERTHALLEHEKLARQRTLVTEEQLWGKAKVGCLLCHFEAGRAEGLLQVADPRQQRNRWKAELARWPAGERFNSPAYADEGNRWFPLGYFDHRSHRDQSCESCHAAAKSTEAKDVLMPKRDACLTCHHQGPNATRSDCLTCHRYHDRSKENPWPLTTLGSVAP